MSRRSWTAAVARALLVLLPREHRERFAGDLEATIVARLAAASAKPLLPRAALLLYLGTDLALWGLAERVRAVWTRALWPNRTPRTRLETRAMKFDWIATDAKQAGRQFLRTPAITATILATLAVGIGATSALFSVVNGVLLQPLPYKAPDQLVAIWSDNQRQHDPNNPVSPADFEALRSVPSLANAGCLMSFLLPLPVQAGSQSEVVQSATLSTNMFDVLGRSALVGRVWQPHETAPGIVLSYAYWQRRFGGDPNVIGQTVSIGSPLQPTTIAAVMPPDLHSRTVRCWARRDLHAPCNRTSGCRCCPRRRARGISTRPVSRAGPYTFWP